MFNWLGNLFPYSDLHSLNLDWILNKMKETAAQAAKAIADSANALAQVIEAKTAAQNAQTAAQNAQTAANNAQTAADNAADSAENAVSVAQAAKSTADAAKSAAQTAQSTADAAKSVAQSAQSAAQTAQNTANTAQSAAQTAQSAAQTASEKVETLKKKFPIHASDISEDSRYSFLTKLPSLSWDFPSTGFATKEEIAAGVMGSYKFLENANSQYWQFSMDIREDGATLSNTVFTCSATVSRYILKESEGLMFLVPIIVVKNNTNQIYKGLIKITRIPYRDPTGGNVLAPKCEVIFETEPPFNANTLFLINAAAVEARISNKP